MPDRLSFRSLGQMLAAAQVFLQRFGTPPTRLARAPGRVELLGNHTDYNQGLVLAAAVDKWVTMAGAPRTDDLVELVSTFYPEPVQFTIGELVHDAAAPWADYVKGVLAQLKLRGLVLKGFNAAVDSTIPLGAGLSSSAALLISTALLVRKLYPYRLLPDGTAVLLPCLGDSELPALSVAEKRFLAHLCQAAENLFVGVKCGLLDHLSSLFGRAGQAILLDFRDLTVNWTPLDSSVALVVCHTGVRHKLVAGEYNDRRATCEAAAAALGVSSLRDVTYTQLAQYQAYLSPHQYNCALHVVGENDRVCRGAELLRKGDYVGFGELLYDSHASSRDYFRNSCPELDILVELARKHPGCLGARLSGGGFGGATINLVQRAAAEAFRVWLSAEYQALTGTALESWTCQVVDGAA